MVDKAFWLIECLVLGGTMSMSAVSRSYKVSASGSETMESSESVEDVRDDDDEAYVLFGDVSSFSSTISTLTIVDVFFSLKVREVEDG